MRCLILILLNRKIVVNNVHTVRKICNFFSIDVKADAAAAAKTKGYAIKDNGERAFKKAFPASKRERYIATIGIAEREKRILPLPSSPFSRLQTDPLCCQLQPHLTCFTDCFDISPCYCYWTVCPPQFFCTVHKRVY